MKRPALPKLLSMLAILVMILVACGPAATPTAAPTQGGAEATQAPAEATQPPAEATQPPAEATQPPAKVYNVIWYQGCPWYADPLPDPEDDIVHQYVLENYGLNLELRFNAECDDGKTTAAIAAGDVPDFMQQYWTTANPILTQLIDQGIVLPIDLEQYPGMKNAISPEAYTFLKRDGQVWGFAPPADPTHETLWVRQDWLDNLGLERPTTPEEALEVARAFTFDDPDGNGQDDTYGLSNFAGAELGYRGIHAFMAPFGFFPGRADLQIADNKAFFPGLSENAKQGLMWLNQAVEEKVIDPAWSTNTEDAFREAVANDKVGMVSYYLYMLNPAFYDVADRIAARGSPADWQWMDPLTGPAGKYMYVQPYNNGIGNAFFVTSQSQSEPGKHEALMRFLNDAIDVNSDLYRVMVWGVKDVTYWTDDQGNIVKRQLDDDHKYLGHYRLFRTGNEEYRVGSWGETQPVMVPGFARADTLPVVFSVRGLVPAHSAQADFDQFIAEKHAAFANGQESFDDWDSFVDEAMTTFSGQEILDDATAQLKSLGLIQ
jgi:putative aldouronate transport system substrate-binding protein